MNDSKITALICDANPFVDYFQPLLYDKSKIENVSIGYNAEMLLPEMLFTQYTTDDIQAYSPRVSRWCLLMFLVESFKITENHVRTQCYIDDEEFPDLELVPYNKFCRMLGYTEINGLLGDYFWGSDNNEGKDSKYVADNYIPRLKTAFNRNMNSLYYSSDEPFEYSLDVVLLKDHRFPNGGMTIKISSDII